MIETARAAVMSTAGLGLRIRGAVIVDDVSLDVAEGEFLVIIGPNGAGKTTLFNLLSGVAKPTSGRVTLRGTDVTNAPPYARARLGLGRTFQTSTIFAELTTLENARLAAQAHLGGSSRLWVLADDQRDALARAHDALGAVGLDARASRQSRVAVARREAQARPRAAAVRRSARGASRRADGRHRGRGRAGDDGT